jgi:hypothetical protein
VKVAVAGFVGLALLAAAAAGSAQPFVGSPGGLSAVGEGVDCFQRKGFDRTYHEQVVTAAVSYQCPSGFIKARNVDTDQTWRIDLLHGGGMSGVDEDGARWRYDPQTRAFTNLKNGRICAHTNPRHVCASADPS